jgi:hypothetical protein
MITICDELVGIGWARQGCRGFGMMAEDKPNGTLNIRVTVAARAVWLQVQPLTTTTMDSVNTPSTPALLRSKEESALMMAASSLKCNPRTDFPSTVVFYRSILMSFVTCRWCRSLLPAKRCGRKSRQENSRQGRRLDSCEYTVTSFLLMPVLCEF